MVRRGRPSGGSCYTLGVQVGVLILRFSFSASPNAIAVVVSAGVTDSQRRPPLGPGFGFELGDCEAGIETARKRWLCYPRQG
jgi:hypothetical protein